MTIPTFDRDVHDDVDPHDRIAQRAYELYLARGSVDGGDFDDWLAAEREFLSVDDGRGDTAE